MSKPRLPDGLELHKLARHLALGNVESDNQKLGFAAIAGVAIGFAMEGNLTPPSQGNTTNGSAPYRRAEHTAVWTGNKMIVWGGEDGWSSGGRAIRDAGRGVFDDGGRYNPATDTWTLCPGNATAPTAK